MSTARVKFYNADRGFGFLDIPETANGLFFHISNVRDSDDNAVDEVRKGDRVSYSSEPSRRKPGEMQAFNIQLLGE